MLILLFQDKDLKRRLKSRSAIEQKVWKVSCSVLRESTPKKIRFQDVLELFEFGAKGVQRDSQCAGEIKKIQHWCKM